MARRLLIHRGMTRPARILALGALLLSAGGCSFLSSMTGGTPAGSASSGAPSSTPEGPSSTGFDSTPPAEASGPTNAAPEPPKPVSVTLRNTCSETVKIFFGDKPKFGSGRYSSLSSNSSTSHSFMPGDMFWIVDESQNGVSSVTIAESTRTVEVQSGCTGLSAR